MLEGIEFDDQQLLVHFLNEADNFLNLNPNIKIPRHYLFVSVRKIGLIFKNIKPLTLINFITETYEKNNYYKEDYLEEIGSDEEYQIHYLVKFIINHFNKQ